MDELAEEEAFIPTVPNVPEERHDQNICRVCRCEGTLEQPLFYPCLCSGSIKYVHQDCLVEWLKHSRKKYCELCKHKFSFTPSKPTCTYQQSLYTMYGLVVYKDQMPDRMPVFVYLRGLLSQLGRALSIGGRYLIVGIVWLAIVPWLTSFGFRFYFGWSAYELITNQISLPSTTIVSSSSAIATGTILVSALLDCIMGLCITSGMILMFLGLMLLKDYMIGQALMEETRPPQRQRRAAGGPIQRQTRVEPTTGDGEAAQSERAPLGGSTAENFDPTRYNWRDHVTSREYRAFIRRQSLHWEKETQELMRRNEERLRRREEPTSRPGSLLSATSSIPISTIATIGGGGAAPAEDGTAQSVIEGARSDTTAFTLKPPTVHTRQGNTTVGGGGGGGGIGGERASVITGGDRRSQRGSDAAATSTIRGEKERENIISTSNNVATINGVSFRDDIRCRICSSRTCINTEHVVLASQRSLEEQRRRRGTNLNTEPTDQATNADGIRNNDANPTTTTNDGNLINSSSTANVEPTTIHSGANDGNVNLGNIAALDNYPLLGEAQVAVPEPDNPLFAFGINVDPDPDVATMTVHGFIGLTGPMFNIGQSALVILLCNFMILHSGLFVPWMLGNFLMGGRAKQLGIRIWQAITVMIVGSEYRLGSDGQQPNLLSTLFFSEEIGKYCKYWRDLTGNVIDGILQSCLPNEYSQAIKLIMEQLKIIWIDNNTKDMTSFIPLTGSLGSTSSFFRNLLIGYILLYGSMSLYRWLFHKKFKSTDTLNYYLGQWTLFFSAFLRLISILFLELVLLPQAIGWVVDVSTIGLVSRGEEGIIGRIKFSIEYPVTSILIHWTLGVMVVVYISVFVACLRSHLRSGLLHFLSNPNDPDYRPIREMVERSVLRQFVRASIALFMYSGFVFVVFGGFTKLAQWLIPNWLFPLPLHITMMDPLAELPIDLLLHLFLRVLLDWIDPAARIGKFFPWYLKMIIRSLKISSYFYGGRFIEEESFPRGGTWVWVPDFDRKYGKDKLNEMQRRQVDPIDIARLPIIEGKGSNGINSTFTTTNNSSTNGTSSNENAGNLSILANGQGSAVQRRNMRTAPLAPITTAVATTATTSSPSPPNAVTPTTLSFRRTSASIKGFTVVFRPNYFRVRVCCFIFSLWLLAMATGFMGVLAPIWIGRQIVQLFYAYFGSVLTLGIANENGFHEMYTFAIGLITLGLLYRGMETIYNSISHEQDRIKLRALLIKFFVIWPLRAFQLSFLAFIIGIIYPILLGGYTFLLLSPILLSQKLTSISSTTLGSITPTPLIHLTTLWSVGIPLVKMFWLFRHQLLSSRQVEAMEMIGWNVPFMLVMRNLILPCLLDLLVMIVGPPSLVLLIGGGLLELNISQILVLQRWSFITAAVAAGSGKVVRLIMKLHRNLMTRIRDETYLVGRQLRNLDQTRLQSNNTSAGFTGIAGISGITGIGSPPPPPNTSESESTNVTNTQIGANASLTRRNVVVNLGGDGRLRT